MFNYCKLLVVEIKQCVLSPLSVSKPPPVVSPTNRNRNRSRGEHWLTNPPLSTSTSSYSSSSSCRETQRKPRDNIETKKKNSADTNWTTRRIRNENSSTKRERNVAQQEHRSPWTSSSSSRVADQVSLSLLLFPRFTV